MSSSEAGGKETAPGRLRRPGLLAAVVLLVLAGVALVVGPPSPSEAYDPANTGPSGLAGLVELLEGSAVDVEVSPEPPNDLSTHLFVAIDRGSGTRNEQILEWVGDGGTLVVAGPSALHGLDLGPGAVSDMFGPTPGRPQCEAPALSAVERVEHAAWNLLTVPDDPADVCFPAGDGAAWLVARTHGEGTIVALGSAAPFANAYLDRADNAVLAASLLAPQPGDRVVVMPPPQVGEGETDVLDLVPPGFWRLLLLLTVAILLAIVWQTRSLGQPVEERLPPVLPSAELARSVAGLLHRSGDRGAAAERLRGDARRHVARTLGLPPSTDRREMVQLVVERTGADQATATTALVDAPVADDGQLQVVAEACARMRRSLREPNAVAADGTAVET